MQQANKYPSNLEGWLLLEKLKEKEELESKLQKQNQYASDLDNSLEIVKDPLQSEQSDPVDYMNSVPISFDAPTKSIQKMSSNSTASSGGNSSDDNENGTSQKPTKYKSPKPTVTESTLLEKHSSAQPEE